MASTRIGINGFGRMGRLALRAAFDWPELESAHVKDGGALNLVNALLKNTQVKILAWYDNEWGYANRLAEIARIVATTLPTAGT
jgi:glyceraldehyde 3-phosphate dehydrogenase